MSRRGCDIVSVAPFISDFPRFESRSVVSQHFVLAVYVPGRQSEVFRETPASVLVDRNWKIVWSKYGVVDDHDVATAVAAAPQ